MLRAALLALSRNARLRHFMESGTLGRRLSARFVAGLHLEDALTAVAACNQAGLSATLDHLGENVVEEEDARAAAGSAIALLQALQEQRLDGNVSVKLTHLGLDLGVALARENLQAVAAQAAALDNFVRVDMEGSAYTSVTLDMVEELYRSGLPIGTVLQAYLHRSEADLRRFTALGMRLRLGKGAYKEPAALALQKKRDVDANFVRLMQQLLASGGYHAIATHDERMIDATLDFARQEGVAPGAFEFQMLYGIRRDLQTRLRRAGWRVRIYVPFGCEWYPYFMRRLAERPANVLFLLRNL